MIRIAVCDDDESALMNLSALIDNYHDEYHKDIMCTTFKSAIDLLDGMRQGNYQLVLLDIIMPYMNGIQAAQEIRSFDKNVKIIFTTYSKDYAMDSYRVKAYSYILKPIMKATFYPLLKDALFDIDQEDEKSIIIKYKAGIARIPYYQLEAIEVAGKTLYFYLSDGSTLEVPGSLTVYEQKLVHKKQFIKTHRAFIVNIRHIKRIQGKEITTFSNKKLIISKTMYPIIKEKFLQYLHVFEKTPVH